MGRAARQRVLTRFSDEAVAVRLRELLDGAQVGNRRAGRGQPCALALPSHLLSPTQFHDSLTPCTVSRVSRVPRLVLCADPCRQPGGGAEEARGAAGGRRREGVGAVKGSTSASREHLRRLGGW